MPATGQRPDADTSDGNSGYDPDYVAEIDHDYYLKCNSLYNRLDQIKDWKDHIPAYCLDRYIVDVEIKIMSDSLDKYSNLIDNDYDDKFRIYEDYTVRQVPSQINAFMGSGRADEFFRCEETAYRTCCSSCRYATCAADCDASDDCENGRSTQEVPCPTVYKNGPRGIDWYNTNVPNVTYTLEDADGFYGAIYSDYGVEKSWIAFGDTNVRVSNGCQYAGENILEYMRKQGDWFWNYPEAADDIEVSNPKDIIGTSYDKSQELLFNLQLLRAIGSLDSLLKMADLADASSLPALTMASAVESMGKVVKEAEEIKEAERKSMIAYFIGGILFFIPFLGQVAGAGMTAVRAALLMAEAAGEAGLLALSIVQDPDNAFMAVFSTLAGAGVSRGSWTKAADQRRDLKTEDAKKLGSGKVGLDKIDDARTGTCKL